MAWRSLFIAIATVPLAALAHGAYPLATSAMEQPGDSQHLVVGTTFGAMLSTDQGQSWAWVCEEALGYQTLVSPKWLVSASGAIFAVGFKGVQISRDFGCSWAAAPEFTATGASDLAIDGATLFASTSTYDVQNKVLKSTDDGLSWRAVGPSSRTAFFSAVKVAPSRTSRVYVSEWYFQPPSAALHVSNDSGEQFERRELTAALPTASAFTLLAVHPLEPDVVFAQVTNDGGERSSFLLKSVDGGRTFAVVLTDSAQFSSLAISDDGLHVNAATANGLYRSHDGGDSFAQVKPPTNKACAFKGSSSAFVCGWPDVDRFAVARLGWQPTDTLQPLLAWSQVTRVPSCSGVESTTTICEPFLPALMASLPRDDATSDAGQGVSDPPLKKGCGCQTSEWGLWLLVLPLILRRLGAFNGFRR